MEALERIRSYSFTEPVVRFIRSVEQTNDCVSGVGVFAYGVALETYASVQQLVRPFIFMVDHPIIIGNSIYFF